MDYYEKLNNILKDITIPDYWRDAIIGYYYHIYEEKDLNNDETIRSFLKSDNFIAYMQLLVIKDGIDEIIGEIKLLKEGISDIPCAIMEAK